jgi:hypothetical protein
LRARVAARQRVALPPEPSRAATTRTRLSLIGADTPRVLCETCEVLHAERRKQDQCHRSGSTSAAATMPWSRAPARRGSLNTYPFCTTTPPRPRYRIHHRGGSTTTAATMRRSGGSRGSNHRHNVAPDLTGSYGRGACQRSDLRRQALVARATTEAVLDQMTAAPAVVISRGAGCPLGRVGSSRPQQGGDQGTCG